MQNTKYMQCNVATRWLWSEIWLRDDIPFGSTLKKNNSKAIQGKASTSRTAEPFPEAPRSDRITIPQLITLNSLRIAQHTLFTLSVIHTMDDSWRHILECFPAVRLMHTTAGFSCRYSASASLSPWSSVHSASARLPPSVRLSPSARLPLSA